MAVKFYNTTTPTCTAQTRSSINIPSWTIPAFTIFTPHPNYNYYGVFWNQRSISTNLITFNNRPVQQCAFNVIVRPKSTPFLSACISGDLKTAKELYTKNRSVVYDISCDGSTALIHAVINNDTVMVDWLTSVLPYSWLIRENSNGESPLFLACLNRRLNLVSSILRRLYAYSFTQEESKVIIPFLSTLKATTLLNLSYNTIRTLASTDAASATLLQTFSRPFPKSFAFSTKYRDDTHPFIASLSYTYQHSIRQITELFLKKQPPHLRLLINRFFCDNHIPTVYTADTPLFFTRQQLHEINQSLQSPMSTSLSESFSRFYRDVQDRYIQEFQQRYLLNNHFFYSNLVSCITELKAQNHLDIVQNWLEQNNINTIDVHSWSTTIPFDTVTQLLALLPKEFPIFE